MQKVFANGHPHVIMTALVMPISSYSYLRSNICAAQSRFFHQPSKNLDPYNKFWGVLGLPANSDSGEVRRAYLKLSKRFHPDSNSPEANVQKFYEIATAYENLQTKFADDRHNAHKMEGEYGLYYQEKKKSKMADHDVNTATESEDTPDKRYNNHTAPQHRQYLSFDGIGSGTMSQREKQYQTHRAFKAVDNVQQHRLKKFVESESNSEMSLVKDTQEAKKIKTGLGIERLVEDMIQESMARGDFQNLKGSGKPLPHDTSSNPYIDFTTHKLNQVLIENGFVPEWILLEKEIRQEIKFLRSKVVTKRHVFDLCLSTVELCQWKHFLDSLEPEVKILNSKIDKYNLVVPSLHKQIIGFQLDRESKRTMDNYSKELHYSTENILENTNSSKSSGRIDNSQSFIDFISTIFKC